LHAGTQLGILTDRSSMDIKPPMARTKEFDRQQVLAAALAVFREHGFEGTSAGMLTEAMKIGRQSLYDTFGDKWRLYCEALTSYVGAETSAHISALNGQPRAADGLRAMIDRTVATAHSPCLGIGSICEFGESRKELCDIRSVAGTRLRAAMVRTLRAAQADGDVARELDPEDLVDFLVGSITGIRVAARAGAGTARLRAMGDLALRALR
jgi:TetR/AcrR family transcriptional repressor of nem operon